MTTVTVEEFRNQLDHYLAATAQHDIVLTQDGRPCYLVRSIRDGSDERDELVESPEFWSLIRQRRQEKGIPWDEAKKQLNFE